MNNPPKHLCGLVAIATTNGRRFVAPHEWERFRVNPQARHLYVADARDPQIDHPVHRSYIAGLWPEAKAKAKKMRARLERDLRVV